jgi:hypothetical protein
VGLLEFHPDRYWESESWEHMGGEKTFTWSANNKSLKQIAEEREHIINKRVSAICKIIAAKMQGRLFADDHEGFVDVLAVKSCGLFCGK